MALDDRLRDGAKELAPHLVDLRHRLHEHPEIGLDLPVTQRTVLAELDGLGLEISTGAGLSSVTAGLRGGGLGAAGPPPGGMGGLPVSQAHGLDYAHPGGRAEHTR